MMQLKNLQRILLITAVLTTLLVLVSCQRTQEAAFDEDKTPEVVSPSPQTSPSPDESEPTELNLDAEIESFDELVNPSDSDFSDGELAPSSLGL